MRNGFSLIELLVVMAIMAILSSSIVLAVNPAKRLAQARDAQRRADIAQMVEALIASEALNGQYPGETGCDSSIGSKITNCPPSPPKNDWDSNTAFYKIMVGQEFLRRLPTDPINNPAFSYRYEPRGPTEAPCVGTNTVCRFWIGGRLESPNNPATQIYRCSNIESLAAGVGCKEVNNFYN